MGFMEINPRLKREHKMKRIISLVASGALFASLAGCNLTQASAVTIQIVDAVQTATVAACKFVPTATTIVNIISAGSATVPSQIANAICAAVTAAPAPGAKLGAPEPSIVINGQTITIVGKFVR